MLETKSIPVQVFSSDDAGAPELKADAGMLKNLLKACLVTGYGDKKPLGWAMPFESGNIAAFRSQDPSSHRRFLKIDNSHANYISVYPYLDMSSLDNGTGLFVGSGGPNNFAYNAPRNFKWLLAGHSKAFIFVLSVANNSQILFFGDVPSLILLDTGNTVIINTHYGSAQSFDTGDINSGNKQYFAKSVLNSNNEPIGALMRSFYWDYAAPYPDLITGGLGYSEIYLTENYSNSVRCLLPGLMSCGNNLNSIADLSPINVGNGQVFIKLNISDSTRENSNFLLNLSAWEA